MHILQISLMVLWKSIMYYFFYECFVYEVEICKVNGILIEEIDDRRHNSARSGHSPVTPTTMNFFDYELSRNATATPPQSASDANTSAEPTLNEEVNQVVGQLGKLWGGFRKQVRGQLHIRSANRS